MKKLVALISSALLALTLAAPVLATKPVPLSATLSISDPNPVWGETIILTASGDTVPTDITMVCTHDNGAGQTTESYSFSIINYNEGPYSDDVGLSAPNWPDVPAVCVANVNFYTFRGHGWKTTVIGSLTFNVSA